MMILKKMLKIQMRERGKSLEAMDPPLKNLITIKSEELIIKINLLE